MILTGKSCVFFALEYSSEDLLDLKRPCDTEEDEVKLTSSQMDSFMFVYQSIHIAPLLKKCWNEMCLLDASYKTTRYALTLFFLVVKTNVDYQVVAAFLIEGETTENIIAALVIINGWNPDFNPLYAMVDCSTEEVNALETLYPVNIGNDITSLELIRLLDYSILFKKI